MPLEMKVALKMTQQLVMTPQLQQAIKLLQLNHLELSEHINEQLVENPALEEVPDAPETDEEKAATESPAPEEAPEPGEVTDPRGDQFDWEGYLEDQYKPAARSPVMPTIADDLPPPETNLSRADTLADHLVWQLQLTDLARPVAEVAAQIIGNVDEDGYLQVSLDELADELRIPEEMVETALARVQEFDPVGVASRDLRECLLIQARVLHPEDKVLEEVIRNHLHDLERRNYQGIARTLGVGLPRIAEAVKAITELEPKPGRAFSSSQPQYITPDVYVWNIGDEWVIQLNEDGMPRLRVSAYVRGVIKSAARTEKEYLQERLRSAAWLIKSIHQRQRTIFKVVESIVEHQKEFLEEGISGLKPMILRDVAEDIEMHESTISRVTTNKYVHTPQGIYELKFFFNSGISRVRGGDVASEMVKHRIKSIISEENSHRPYSDQQIVEILKQQNIDIARRTVAKYREMLGILSSSKRKKII